jgi:hypothetical protein
MAEKAFAVLLKLQTNLAGFYRLGLILHFVVNFLSELYCFTVLKIIKFCFFIILKIQQNKLCPWGLGAGVFFSNLWFESLAKLSKKLAFGSNLHFFFLNVQVSFPHSAKIHPIFLKIWLGVSRED